MYFKSGILPHAFQIFYTTTDRYKGSFMGSYFKRVQLANCKNLKHDRIVIFLFADTFIFILPQNTGKGNIKVHGSSSKCIWKLFSCDRPISVQIVKFKVKYLLYYFAVHLGFTNSKFWIPKFLERVFKFFPSLNYLTKMSTPNLK